MYWLMLQVSSPKSSSWIACTQWWSLAWASRAIARGSPTLFCALQGPPQKVNVAYLPQIFVAHLRLL